MNLYKILGGKILLSDTTACWYFSIHEKSEGKGWLSVKSISTQAIRLFESFSFVYHQFRNIIDSHFCLQNYSREHLRMCYQNPRTLLNLQNTRLLLQRIPKVLKRYLNEPFRWLLLFYYKLCFFTIGPI